MLFKQCSTAGGGGDTSYKLYTLDWTRIAFSSSSSSSSLLARSFLFHKERVVDVSLARYCSGLLH